MNPRNPPFALRTPLAGRFPARRVGLGTAVLGLAVLLGGCGGDRSRRVGPGSEPARVSYAATPIGRPVDGRPWIAHVTVVDLDQDGRRDVLVSDAGRNAIDWIRQTAPGEFEERVLAEGIAGPVHAEVADLDGDGDLEVLVASMGQVFPNNARIGAVVVLENRGDQTFVPRTVLERTSRVTDVRAADLNGDGRLDLALAQFGYDQGEVAWLEQRGPWTFERRVVLDLPGAVNVVVADLTGDGSPDLAANISQEFEEIHLLENDGRGRFTDRVIHGSTNEDFGSSGLALADLNRDGRPDLLFTNGDGFDYAEPGERPWHGVQWLENLGQGVFRYHRIGDLAGAFSPVAADVNGDGALDVVASSGFNRWENAGAVSLMVFLNDGRQRFTPHVLARRPTHLMTVAVAPLDGPERPPVIVTGGFHAYPPWDHLSRVLLWRQSEVP